MASPSDHSQDISASAPQATPQRTWGRQIEFTQQTADVICDAIAEGMSLRSICALDGMPAKSTVRKWLALVPSFATQYAVAREAQAEHYADEMTDIADDGTNDFMERRKADGSLERVEYNGDSVQRSRLRIDTRKWIASKMLPKKYGDRSDLNVTGSITLEHWVLESMGQAKNVTPAIEGQAKLAGSGDDPEGDAT